MCRLFKWTYVWLDRGRFCQEELSNISILTSWKTAHDNLRLLRIEQGTKDKLEGLKIRSSQLKGAGRGEEVGADRAEGLCLLRIKPTFCCCCRTSAAVEETMVAHVLLQWFRRQHGGLGKENKFITLPYLHITPQRAVNEDWRKLEGLIPCSKSY